MSEPVIICVDDEDIVVKSLKRELNEAFGESYLIEAAESGKDAVELVEELLEDQYEIPVIITDHIMPDMKGDELLQRVHGMSPKTLKIMLTGQADLEAVTNAVNYANLYHYIAKPWEKTNLILTVKGAIHRYYQDKQLEEQNAILQNMNTILEQQVKERTAELEAQKHELKNANASKDKFFSIISHDLRSPFTGLLSLTQTVSENIEDFSQEDIKGMLDSLQKTAKTVYTLLENLLTWSRLQRGIIEYFPRELFLDQIVKNSLSLFASNAEQKQISLRNLVTEPLSAYADSDMLQTVLRNLISNALKFTGTGGAVEISAVPSETAIEVAVLDTGVGIKQKEMEKLFRIDFKYTNVGTGGEKGSGLGLILCKELVEQNGGRIWVESEIGKGTTFKFTVPMPPY